MDYTGNDQSMSEGNGRMSTLKKAGGTTGD